MRGSVNGNCGATWTPVTWRTAACVALRPRQSARNTTSLDSEHGLSVAETGNLAGAGRTATSPLRLFIMRLTWASIGLIQQRFTDWGAPRKSLPAHSRASQNALTFSPNVHAPGTARGM